MPNKERYLPAELKDIELENKIGITVESGLPLVEGVSLKDSIVTFVKNINDRDVGDFLSMHIKSNNIPPPGKFSLAPIPQVYEAYKTDSGYFLQMVAWVSC